MTKLQENCTYELEQVFFPLLALFASRSPGTGIKLSLPWLFDLLGDLRRSYTHILTIPYYGNWDWDEEFKLMEKLEQNNGPFKCFLRMGPPAAHMHLPEYLKRRPESIGAQNWMAKFDVENRFDLILSFDKGLGKVFLSSVQDQELLKLLQSFVDAYMPTSDKFQEPCALALI